MLGAPHALQCCRRIRFQAFLAACLEIVDERASEHAHVVHGEIESLRAGGRHDVGRVPGEEQPTIAHWLDYEAAHGDDAALEYAAFGELPGLACREARVQLLPDACIRPVVDIVL